MTIITNDGLKWYRDISVGDDENIDAVALGTGITETSISDTSLQNEVYRGTKSDINVTIRKGDNYNEFDVYIDVTGGSQISAGTEITEIGVFAESGTSDEVMIARDVFNSVELVSGIKERFSTTIRINR